MRTREMVQGRWREDKRLQEKFIPWSKTPEGMKELERIMAIHVGISSSLLHDRKLSSLIICKR